MSGGFTWYVLGTYIGLGLTAWRLISQNHVITKAKAEIARLREDHEKNHARINTVAAETGVKLPDTAPPAPSPR